MEQFSNANDEPDEGSERDGTEIEKTAGKMTRSGGKGIGSRGTLNNSAYNLLSRHFRTIVVAILFLAVLGALSIYLYTHEKPDAAVVSIFSTMLAGLGAYFINGTRGGQK